MRTTGEVIREIREQKGLSRDEVIRRSPYWSYQAWGRLERGDRRLTVEELIGVAQALKMDTIELLKLLIESTKNPSRGEDG